MSRPSDPLDSGASAAPSGTTESLRSDLRKYLTDYCARCDSHGHVTTDGSARPFCGVCWSTAKPIPPSLKKLILRVIEA